MSYQPSPLDLYKFKQIGKKFGFGSRTYTKRQWAGEMLAIYDKYRQALEGFPSLESFRDFPGVVQQFAKAPHATSIESYHKGYVVRDWIREQGYEDLYWYLWVLGLLQDSDFISGPPPAYEEVFPEFGPVVDRDPNAEVPEFEHGDPRPEFPTRKPFVDHFDFEPGVDGYIPLPPGSIYTNPEVRAWYSYRNAWVERINTGIQEEYDFELQVYALALSQWIQVQNEVKTDDLPHFDDIHDEYTGDPPPDAPTPVDFEAEPYPVPPPSLPVHKDLKDYESEVEVFSSEHSQGDDREEDYQEYLARARSWIFSENARLDEDYEARLSSWQVFFDVHNRAQEERLEELNAEYQDEVEVYLEVFETWLDAYNEWLKEHFAVDGVDVAGLDLNDDGEFNEEDLFGNPFGRGNRVGQPPRPYGPVMPMPQWPHPLPFHVPRANIDVRGFDGLPRIPDEIGE